MREIKFKAWCYKTNMMYYHIDEIHWLLGGEVIRANSVISEISEHRMSNEYTGEQNFKLLQYIGIKDINKHPIYERDICVATLPGPIKILASIDYDNESASFQLFYKTHDNESASIPIDSEIILEIVGNIYESDIKLLKKAYNREFNIDDILQSD